MWKLKIGDSDNNNPWLASVNNFLGRQHWEFDTKAGTPDERALVERLRQDFSRNRYMIKQSSDLLMRMQLTKESQYSLSSLPAQVKLLSYEAHKITEEEEGDAVTITLRRSISFYSAIQTHNGHWPAESSGALFFMPPLIFVLYIMGCLNAVLSPEHQKEVVRYMYNHQNEDGGWGFHIEGHSTMIGSALNYIALRLLGEGPDDHGEDGVGAMAKGQKWILDHGGLEAIPSWGKVYLSVLGVYKWEGCNPFPPEFWLLPDFLPIHPGHILSCARLVFMPMSYLYGKRFVGPITRLIISLREDLYNHPYQKIDWNKARNTVAKEDLYYPHAWVADLVFGFLHKVGEPILTRWPFSELREKALGIVMKHIHYEDENSQYLCIANVQKILCLLACWVENQNSEIVKRHFARIPDYFWVAEDGMKLQSFGSQMWDTAFSVQAILSSNLIREYGTTLRKAHDFIKGSQVRVNPSGDFSRMYRHISKGAWTFSTADQGWQASDCTAEGLKAALLLSQISPDIVGEKLESEWIYDAVNVLLSLQSSNGGFPAWESAKAFRWIQLLNPTELFGEPMAEKEHVECTSSAVQALVLFIKLYPDHREKEIRSSIRRAIKFIEELQNPDGSWYAFWGICYTYGTWFAVKALVACGKNYHNSLTIRKACVFLLSKQLQCGGWGESYLSSANEVYTNLEGNRSHLVQTAWAMLSLIDAGQAKIDPKPLRRGLRVLINSQMEDGDFPQQDITGVFMKTCTLNYGCYRNIFPIWALGEYRKQVLSSL